MKTALRILFVLTVICTFSQLSLGLSINETWSGPADPTGWSIHSYQGTGFTTTGTARTNYLSNGYFQLTESSVGWERTTALYTADTFSTSESFSFQADYRVQTQSGRRGADGLSFFWVDKSYLDSNSIDPANLEGGYGKWQGAPHGATSGDIGYYDGIRGYSFELDHEKDSKDEQLEYTHFIRITDWSHLATNTQLDLKSNNDDFYENNGWQRAYFSFDGDTETFSYYLEDLDDNGDPNGIKTEIVTFTIDSLDFSGEGDPSGAYETFSEAYFGIAAGTGTDYAEHDIRNLTFVPEPATLIVLGLGGLFAVNRRKQN
ncbi:PEP-CTERM protein sorting domain protein [Limihaloglobus sulfuriphilus]|uniref:PEP-CTERM protein sorting domain protein n=1 Tax=Limihaloglobus sulfuriphilus TaxID=1851148 RepID=A0A1R7T5W8_9BACT|nr:PEP-CTERM sorting domain-containing protein [Limihaloglobus sulfuriphilus]AQQ71906.1 PEP-CTERM protein sorting domain protein [Limihaloglobus sulfuriphilus]